MVGFLHGPNDEERKYPKDDTPPNGVGSPMRVDSGNHSLPLFRVFPALVKENLDLLHDWIYKEKKSLISS